MRAVRARRVFPGQEAGCRPAGGGAPGGLLVPGHHVAQGPRDGQHSLPVAGRRQQLVVDQRRMLVHAPGLA